MIDIDVIKKQRFQFLLKLYEASNGGAELKLSSMNVVGEELGFNIELTEKIVEYLNKEGLIEWMSAGLIYITHEGVKEIEEASNKSVKSTEAVNIINIGQMTNSQIQQNSPDAIQTNIINKNKEKRSKEIWGVWITGVCAIIAALISSPHWGKAKTENKSFPSEIEMVQRNNNIENRPFVYLADKVIDMIQLDTVVIPRVRICNYGKMPAYDLTVLTVFWPNKNYVLWNDPLATEKIKKYIIPPNIERVMDSPFSHKINVSKYKYLYLHYLIFYTSPTKDIFYYTIGMDSINFRYTTDNKKIISSGISIMMDEGTTEKTITDIEGIKFTPDSAYIIWK